MPRITHRLSALAVTNLSTAGLHADGDGLYLRVTRSGSKGWIFRFKLGGRSRDMGLGAFPSVNLAAARKLAGDAREALRRGDDPIAERNAKATAARLKRDKAVTFRTCAEQLIASHEVGWRNGKHRQQWRNTLATYAYPLLGDLPVADVGTELVSKVLQQPVQTEHGKKAPLWHVRTETASRLRGRIESVLSWAKARGLRTGENPAQWRGHLDQLLPARSTVRRVQHHPALPYVEMPAFMAKLRAREGVAARALEYVILTAARTGEALGASWDEIDFEAKLWTVPAGRMKAQRQHKVPLPSRAVAILEQMAEIRQNDFVFPGMTQGKPLSDMALLMLLRDMHVGITTHGFRSTFKDWCAECTHTPNFVSEAALAHVVADKVEAAYRRAELIEKRRELMDAWAAHCARKPALAEVVPLRQRTRAI